MQDSKTNRLTKPPVRSRLCALFPLGLLVAPALARDVDFTVGLRGWGNTWDTWRAQSIFYGSNLEQIGGIAESATRVALTPSVNVKYQNVLLSASYLTPRTYPLTDQLGTPSLSGRRQEFDASAGYFFLPRLNVNLGYKQVDQSYGAGTFKWTGPTIGIAGSASLSPRWGIYGSFSYGLLNLTAPAGALDAPDNKTYHATYAVGEFGLAYSLNFNYLPRALTLSAGYRGQLLSTRSIPLTNNASLFTAHDHTQGPTVGLAATF
jgi:hypothetical protein